MDTRGRMARWRGRMLAAWPAIEGRLLAEGGLRSILILVIALFKGAGAEEMVQAVATGIASLLGIVALLMPPPCTAAQRGRAFLLARLSEPGTLRSVAVVFLGLSTGISAETMAEHLEAVAIVLLGTYSAARPAQAVR